MTTPMPPTQHGPFGSKPPPTTFPIPIDPIPIPPRQEKVEVHTADTSERNAFLTDLQLLDTGEMNAKVRYQVQDVLNIRVCPIGHGEQDVRA